MPTEKIRQKPGGYHGVQNVKFAKRTGEAYAATPLALLYAQGIKLTPQIGETKQHADNRELFKIPSDTGLTGELKTTAPDPELDKAAGFSIEGDKGLYDVDMTAYVRGALYFEYISRDGHGVASTVKAWLLNVELGKGAKSFETNADSVKLGDYTYSFQVYGEEIKKADGTGAYLDDNGMSHRCHQIAAYPGDADYATFGDTVPVPKAVAVTPPVNP